MRRKNITDEYLTFHSIMNVGLICGESSYYMKLHKLAFNWCLSSQMSLYHEVCYWGFEVLYE